MSLALEDVIPLHLATFRWPENTPGVGGEVGVVYSCALRHPDGLFLFETGIGRGVQRLDDYYHVIHHPLEDALAGQGHGIGDVRMIVNSHLHFDHCGNNARFPGVPIYVQASEYEAAHQAGYTVPEWIDFDGAEYVIIEGDKQLAPGVRVAATPGHTVGHQSLLIDTRDGLVALAGQAIFTCGEYDQLRTTGQALDFGQPADDRYITSAKSIIDLEPRRVHFSHDGEVWDAHH